MREALALTVFLLISGSTLVLAVKNRIGTALVIVFLAFSLLSGLAIANYDWIRQVQWEVPGLEVFQQKVNTIQNGALEGLKQEAENQKKAIAVLVSSVSDTSQRFDAQKKALDGLLEAMQASEENLKRQERKLKEIGDTIEHNRDRTLAAYQAASQLSLLLTRLTWLQVQSGTEGNEERHNAAIKQILDELDEIVNLIIVDPAARTEFITGVMNSLQPAQ